jgi:hypothetical protein
MHCTQRDAALPPKKPFVQNGVALGQSVLLAHATH